MSALPFVSRGDAPAAVGLTSRGVRVRVRTHVAHISYISPVVAP